MSEISKTTVTVAGVRSPVLQTGSLEAREAVVFVHGNPGPADDWRDLLARTGEFARAVAPHMPGFGEADKPRGFRYTIGGFADHLAGVLEDLGIDRAHLVLHDFGGPWGLAWAARHPDAFASATLINTCALPDYRWHRYARIWRTPAIGELWQLGATRSAFRMLVGRENPRLSGAALDGLYEAGGGWGTKRAILKLYRATPAKALRGPVEALRVLDRPALVLFGTGDSYVPWQLAERQREAFPSARVQLLEGLGHFPFHEDPGQVAEHVIPFLRSQFSKDDVRMRTMLEGARS
jgi:pimeloyl-ACP methyl ester carboxylesterase